ncbi:SAV0927 family protein [Alkalihalobacterium alkalinitrilicum]|uniref:SAV0927 family protein n=1 Tax=Alkalihalobacterium alkalinitrilicum TaxID=427920 RepID=UPI0009956137|nr:SAV0927 family protein [Alkalihalobacterium alkalinitrilicum]
MFESIYTMDEFPLVQHIGYATEERSYDFTLVFSGNFFGKTLVSCLQSGNSTLLDYEDVGDLSVIKQAFKIIEDAPAQDISTLLLTKIPISANYEQY